MSETTRPANSRRADISVIVITFNRAPMLAQTLASLVELETTLPSGESFTYEVIVVNNASTDNTQEVIDGYASDTNRGSALRIRSFYEQEPGVAPARNRGLSEANSEWIAFHDDDQKAHPQWLAKLLELAHRKQVKVVGGAVKLLLPEGNTRQLAPQCRVLLGERVGWDAEAPYTRKRIPGTNNILIHQSILDEVGNFNTALKVGGTDADLYRRIRNAGHAAWYTPDSIVYHMIPEKRLGDEYMKWTATRHGMHLALREYLDWGPTKLAAMMILRTGQACANYLPRFLVAKLTGQREKALGARALLWRSQAYLARAFELLRRGDTDDTTHDKTLSFREGREKLVRGATST
ncbi:glycosyltransferase family 2 protein [Botrimarina hoheduenensis]|uniref:Chondroitin synthase n=1 Tax=Botrimarina hoheduenensis TaxID=2528000 RepID=A0A5C5WF33_9BACT|nr:glycosyltransferase family A protein [Botrimarina hoheduenensis]TWT48711.1 Chondroitin synthase [Botrimarina hoheduenensis]